MRINKTILLLLLGAVLSGCTGTGQTTYMPQEKEATGSPYSDRNDAVGTLLDRAWNSMQEGDLGNASGWLSRAMRINPTEPAIYFYMAQVRKEQGELRQARELADRALSLAPEAALERKLQRFLTSLKS